MAGCIWAYYVGFIYPQFAVDPLVTIGAVLMAFLGGRGTIWGPMLGALILVPAQQYLAYSQGASQLYLIVYCRRLPGRDAADAARHPARRCATWWPHAARPRGAGTRRVEADGRAGGGDVTRRCSRWTA